MGEERERDEQGQYTSSYSDAEILDIVEQYEPASTKQIAEELNIARQSADYRLRKLLDQGSVSKKKIGNSLAWSTSGLDGDS
jgi:predicted transcriptional regulator